MRWLLFMIIVTLQLFSNGAYAEKSLRLEIRDHLLSEIPNYMNLNDFEFEAIKQANSREVIVYVNGTVTPRVEFYVPTRGYPTLDDRLRDAGFTKSDFSAFVRRAKKKVRLSGEYAPVAKPGEPAHLTAEFSYLSSQRPPQFFGKTFISNRSARHLVAKPNLPTRAYVPDDDVDSDQIFQRIVNTRNLYAEKRRGVKERIELLFDDKSYWYRYTKKDQEDPRIYILRCPPLDGQHWSSQYGYFKLTFRIQCTAEFLTDGRIANEFYDQGDMVPVMVRINPGDYVSDDLLVMYVMPKGHDGRFYRTSSDVKFTGEEKYIRDVDGRVYFELISE